MRSLVANLKRGIRIVRDSARQASRLRGEEDLVYFVEYVYRQVLGRAPDLEGLRYFVISLQNGRSFAHVVEEIEASPEAKRRIALTQTQSAGTNAHIPHSRPDTAFWSRWRGVFTRERDGFRAELAQRVARQDDEIDRLRVRLLGLENALRSLTATRKIILTPTDGALAGVADLVALLKPHDVARHQKARVGGDHDGGYVMLDDFESVETALSLGIGADASWDLALAQRGIRVVQFDHAIETSPSTHERCVFFGKRIVPSQPVDSRDTTIAQVLDEHAAPSDDRLILKIDIEGSEWDVFDALAGAVVDRFAQIVCEFHDFHRILEADWRDRAVRVLTKLNGSHTVVHIHGNNFRPIISIGDILIPEVIELTFVRSRSYATTDAQAEFPGPLDNPNNSRRLDYYLGSFDLWGCRDVPPDRVQS